MFVTPSTFFGSTSLPPSLLRHGGGGRDLHWQGAAERHEHLQPQAQGTVAQLFVFCRCEDIKAWLKLPSAGVAPHRWACLTWR